MGERCTSWEALGRLRPIANPAPTIFESNPRGGPDLRFLFHGGTMPDLFARRICETSAVRQTTFFRAAFSWASIKGAKT